MSKRRELDSNGTIIDVVKQRVVIVDGRSYTVSPWTLGQTLSNRPIVDGVPELYRGYSSSEDEECPADHAMLQQHEHHSTSDQDEDAARYRRDQTNRSFAISQANFARYKASLGSSHKPTYSNEQLAKDFHSANETLKVRWQECNVSHAEKLVMAENHNKRMEPHTKTHLLKNLQRKMGFFQKKLEHLPLVLDVDTDSKRFAYIQDAESITKMLDAYINWKWDNQAIEYMGF